MPRKAKLSKQSGGHTAVQQQLSRDVPVPNDQEPRSGSSSTEPAPVGEAPLNGSNGNDATLRQRYNIPDPRGNYTIRVSEQSKLRFLRSSQFYQDQVSLEDNQGNRQALDPQDKEFLLERGWKDRGDEKIMTRQLARPTEQDPYARSKSDRQFEGDFIELAQRIRADNGLPPHEAYESMAR